MRRQNPFWAPPRVAAVLIASSGLLWSQSNPVGGITGTVKGPDGKPLARALVQAQTSRGSLEERTGEKGEFSFRQILPGKVRVKVSAPGTAGFDAPLTVIANQTNRMDIRLAAEGIVVEVVDALATESVDPTQARTGMVMTMAEVEDLPIMYMGTERLEATLFRTPGAVFDSFHGTDGRQNTYLVDGVSIAGANYGGKAVDLNNDFIDQIQVLTSGISAKYGRFTGGVINLTTKSGTNEYSGSTRLQITNEKWNSKYRMPEVAYYYSNKYHSPLTWSPVPDHHQIVQTYTFTGPIIKDKLFFALAYLTSSPQLRMASQTNPSLGDRLPYVVSRDENRLDAKIDWQVATGHRLSFEANETDKRDENGISNGNVTTLATLSGLTKEKTGYRSLGYLAQLSSSLSLDVKVNDQYTRSGGPGTGPVGGRTVPTWKEMESGDVLDNGFGSDQANRSNMSTGAANLLWVVEAAGSHEVETGFQFYHYSRNGAAAVTPSGYLISFRGFAEGATTYKLTNRILTARDMGTTELDEYKSVTGTADTRVNSLYVNDTWKVSGNWSFNLGARYDKYKSAINPEGITYDFQSFTPRLGANYDLRADGAHVFSAGLAEYAGMILQGDLAAATVTSSPITRRYVYLGTGGPNTGNGQDALLADGTINWAAWGNSKGLAGQAHPEAVADPLTDRNVFVDPNIKAPRTREVTLGYRYTSTRRSFSATLIRRWNDRFLDDFWYGDGMGKGLARKVIKNDPSARQDYYGLELSGRTQLGEAFSVGASGTWSRAFANAGINLGGASSQRNNFGTGNIPDSQLSPEGPSPGQDIPVMANADVSWRHSFGGGTLNLGLLGTYKSGAAVGFLSGYNANVPEALRDQGYDPTFSRYYPEKGVVRQPEAWTLDLQVGYDQKLPGKTSVYAKINISNVLNRVRPMTRDYSGKVGDFDPNPYNTPQDGTQASWPFQPSETFGLGQGNLFPRSVQAIVGFKF